VRYYWYSYILNHTGFHMQVCELSSKLMPPFAGPRGKAKKSALP
jgi:hypothetical protein